MITERAVGFYCVLSCVVLLSAFPPEASAGDISNPLPATALRLDLFDTTPVRGLPKPLQLKRAGFTYRCDECHRDLKVPAGRSNLEAEHANIVFNHGTDLNCQVCHHVDNRDAYVDRECRQMPSENSVELCAKCHNTEYRDWREGIHGRLNGYWDSALGPQTHLQCIQCHDPHSPAFQPVRPLPPPLKTRAPYAKKRTPHE